MDDEGRVFLTAEQAEAMLADGDTVHTFRRADFFLIGADWQRQAVVEYLRSGRPELAGPGATATGHGLACTDADGSVVFFATRRPNLGEAGDESA